MISYSFPSGNLWQLLVLIKALPCHKLTNNKHYCETPNSIFVSPECPSPSLCDHNHPAGRRLMKVVLETALSLQTAYPACCTGRSHHCRANGCRPWTIRPSSAGTLASRAGPPAQSTTPGCRPAAPASPGCGLFPWTHVQSRALESKPPGFKCRFHHNTVCVILNMLINLFKPQLLDPKCGRIAGKGLLRPGGKGVHQLDTYRT